MRIIVKPTKSGRFVWNFVARNGRITANNETHPTRSNAVRAAKSNVRNVARMLLSKPVVDSIRFETHRDGNETHILVVDEA